MKYGLLTDFEKAEVKRLRAEIESVRTAAYWMTAIPVLIIALIVGIKVYTYYLGIDHSDWSYLLYAVCVTISLYQLITPAKFFISDYRLRQMEKLL